MPWAAWAGNLLLAFITRRLAAFALPSKVDMLVEQKQRRIARSTRRFMGSRVDIEIVCPNNHNQTVTFNQEEFDKMLQAGSSVFHCNTCDVVWSPTHDEIAKIRKRLA